MSLEAVGSYINFKYQYAMSDPRPDRIQYSNIIRWSARILSSVLASLWSFVAVVSIILGPLPTDPESIVMAFLIVMSIIGVFIAWFRELHGGVILLIVGSMHSVFAIIVAGHNKLVAVLISGVPFIVSGILFLALWRASEVTNKIQIDA